MRPVVLIVALLMFGCTSNEQFHASKQSLLINQSYNPPVLDILFMVNDGSPMSRVKEHLFSEATQFFKRLDQIPEQYRLGFINHDMERSAGRLQPLDKPYILEKKVGVGSIEERAKIFKDLLSLVINVQTSPEDRGIQSAFTSLQNHFKPRENVPVVIVFISDRDDKSAVPTGTTDVIDYYKTFFLTLKNNRADLVRVYSINYEPLATGETVNNSNRCATMYNADIDKAGFEDRYFEIAEAFNSSSNVKVTADLCGPFSSLIDLSGLRLKELPRIFPLNAKANPSTLSVKVEKNNQTLSIPWKYDESTQSIVFETAPPEASQINISYLPI